MDVYVNGEPAGTWETATGNTESTYHEIDVTGIEDLDALEQYFNETGIIPYEMVNGKKVYLTFAKLPQNNTAVSASAINDLIAIAGGSMVAGYNTEGTIAKLAKSTVFNAIMRAMFLTIEGNTVAQNVIDQIENALNPFCINDTDDIPVYVDSNGVAHVLADAVEAVRDKLIDMGAYTTEDEPAPPISETTLITKNDLYSHSTSQVSITPAIYNSIPSNCFYKGDTIYYNEGNYNFGISRFCTPSTHADIYVPDYIMYLILNNYNVRALPVFENPSTDMINLGRLTEIRDYADGRVQYGSSYNLCIFEYNGKQLYALSGVSSSSGANTYNTYYAGQNKVPNTDPRTEHIAYAILNGTEAGGITGMTVSTSIPVGFGDIALPLPDVWPDWYARKKQVATPADDDLFLRSPALPLDVPVDNVFDDGYAGDSDQDTTGDLADILKQAIVDAIPDVLDQIIADTAVTEEDVYRIPVDDGGNTPPPTPPVLDGSSNGLWTMYNPTKTQVNEFGAWLWSDTIIDQIIRQFNSPIDAIIGFHQIYCTPSTGAAKTIKAGYLNSPVSAAEVTNQYTTIDCGTVHVDEFYGNVLDYDNSQVSVYLPFIGIVPLNTNVVMGSDLQIIYRIDVFTGTCLAQIKVIKENSNAVMYAFDGNCAVQIPLTATTYTGMIGALISGISAGVSFATGDMLHAATSGISAAMSALNGQTGNKQSGTMGSNAGALGIRKPYLIITRAISTMPAGFENIAGLPSTELVQLNSLSGFTSIRNVHLEGIPGTAEEIEEIKSLLESGVIF